MYNTNDIFSVVKKATDSFNQDKITIVDTTPVNGESIRYLGNDGSGYKFSQREMLNDVDLAYSSQYKTGMYDDQGRRKSYINVVRFYTWVAIKNTQLNISNYQLTPIDYTTDNMWESWFFTRQFAFFVRDNNYGETIDDLNFDFNKYGTCLSKKINGTIVRVPLKSIKNDQSARTLLDGIRGGTPFIQEHNLSNVEISEYEEWNEIDDFEGKRLVQECYLYIPTCEYEKLRYGTESEAKGKTLVMAMIMPSGKLESDKRLRYENKLLFIEEITEEEFSERYQECHSEQQDGRWLGIGEVEKQLENQIARNHTVNLRQRAMEWSAKGVFQTQGDEIGRSLVKDVEDGEVLQVGVNGLISRVDTQTRGLADFASNEETWNQNSKEISFAFDVATGDSLPSGTPFRLGAMLSNSVMSYFKAKQQKFGMYLERSFFNQIIPVFQTTAKEDMTTIMEGEQGFEDIRNLFVEWNVNQEINKIAVSPQVFDMEEMPDKEKMKKDFEEKLMKSPYFTVTGLKKIYKKAKYKVQLDLTGQSRSIADRETLITLYTTMAKAGDPRANKVLDVVLSSMGKTIPSIAGIAKEQVAPEENANPDLAGLLPQDANQQ